MNFDFESHLGAAERSVSFLERDGRPASAVTISRSLTSTVEDVWDAVTSGDRIPRWAMPISGELELGGRFQLEGNASGAITECEPLSRFSVTWEFAGDVSWVELRFSDGESGSPQLSVTHTAHLSPHWDEYGPGAVGVGWESALAGLALHLEHPNEPKPDEMEFVTSPDGKAFITGSSEAWGEAAVAAGTDPDAASAAARSTTAFYTGESA